MRFEQADPTRLYELFQAAQRVDDPNGPPMTQRYYTAMVTHGWAGEPQELWLSADGTAGGTLELPERDNRHAAMAGLYVHPDHRRRGLGREILAHLIERTRANGRRRLISDAPSGSPGHAFAAAAGAEKAIEDVRQVLRLGDVPAGLPDSADGYELVRWEGMGPPESRDELAALRATMNDAPIGDMDWEDSVWDADRVDATRRAYELHGIRAYTVAARHIGSGELAGYTEVHLDGDVPWLHQEDTAVVRAHRGHRLGLVLKAAMIEWMREREPAANRAVTWNAASNTYMRAVNDRLGFTVLDHWHNWQLKVG